MGKGVRFTFLAGFPGRWLAWLAVLVLLVTPVLMGGCQNGGNSSSGVQQEREDQGTGSPPALDSNKATQATAQGLNQGDTAGGKPEENLDLVSSPLTGLQVPRDLLQRRPVAVVIGNNPKARPQAGLQEADLVFEVLVEGGITRFLAFYLGGEPELVGPVRSARHYFIDLVLGLDAVFAHTGGSPYAGKDIARFHVPDFDDVLGTGFGAFWLDKERERPNSTYTSIPRLRSLSRQRGFEKPDPVVEAPFEHRSGEFFGPQAEEIKIHFPGYLGYTVEYKYTPTGKYLRSGDGKPHRDAADGEQLRAENIIVQFTKTWPIPGDQEGRLEMELTGEGEIQVFSRGVQREGVWKKESRQAPIRYFDQEGKPLVLAPGKTWVAIVPPGTLVEVK